jgi:thiamine-phosphate pyrophosphorylase
VRSRLYVICDAEVCAHSGWTLVDFAAACLDGGATLLQLRAKSMTSRQFLTVADAVVGRAARLSATVIVNDRADIAMLSKAQGVHVGQDDLAPADVRKVVGPEPEIGLSTHTIEQLTAAVREPVTYLAIGPVFGTVTKETGHAPVGLDMVRRAAGVASGRMPVVAIGGITIDRAPDVIAAGAGAVAVISDLLATGDPSARVREYLDRLARV